MTEFDVTVRCRRCAADNPMDNTYCRKCGAVLQVSTAEIAAQPKPVMPVDRRFKWRFVGLGMSVMLGMIALLLGVSFLIFGKMVDGTEGVRDLADDMVRLFLVSSVLFLVAFGVSALIIVWILRRTAFREVVFASVLVTMMLGVVGSMLAMDFLIVAGIAVIPSGASAWFGSRLGESFFGGSERP